MSSTMTCGACGRKRQKDDAGKWVDVWITEFNCGCTMPGWREPVPSEPVAWLFNAKKPGRRSEWASVDRDDTCWWPADQGWIEVTRTPLIVAGKPESILPAKYAAPAQSDPKEVT